MRRFQDKTVIVTGAAQGMGQEFSWRFAEEGAHVVAVDINGERLDETVAGGPAGAIEPLVLDVSDPDAVQAAFARVAAAARPHRRARQRRRHRPHGRHPRHHRPSSGSA